MNQKDKLLDNTKKVLKFFFGIPLTILSFYFITSIILKSKNDIFTNIHEVKYLPLFSGIIFLVIFFVIRAIVWQKIIEKEGYLIPRRKSIFYLSFSELRRYIPGNIFGFSSRIAIFAKEKVPAKALIKSIGVEAFIFILSSIFISTPGIIYFLNTTKNNSLLGSSGSSFLVLFVSVTVLTLISYYFFKKFNLTKSKILSFTKYKEIFFISCVSWIFFGIGNFLIVASVKYLDAYYFISIASFFVLSWLIGYLSFITPMGFGVREAVVIYLFSFSTPVSLAAAIAIFLRIALIISEMLTVGILYISYKIKFKFPSTQIAILAFSILSYITYFSYVTFQKHNNFFTGRFDLGNMDQTVWNTLHGRLFTLTNPDGVNIISRLGIHADYILVLLSPFYLLWESPKMLLFIQSAVLGLGAIFIYLISNKILSNKNISLILSTSYLINPLVQRQNLYDFHAITLATTLLLSTFLFMILKKYKLFAFFLFLSILTKENILLISSMFGFYLFTKNKKIIGSLLFIFSFIAFYATISFLIPNFRGGDHFAVSYFQDFGDKPTEILKNFILMPNKLLSLFFSQNAIYYFYRLLLPVGFLSLLAPFYLIFAIPDLFINVVSNNSNFTNITFHYSSAIIPFIYVAAIYGIRKIILRNYKYINIEFLSFYIILLSIFSAWSLGPLPGAKNPSIEMFSSTYKERGIIQAFLSKIPNDKSVSATNNLGAHLSHREHLYTVPTGLNDADYLIFLLNDSFAQPSLSEQQNIVNSLKRNKMYKLIYEINDFYAFKKANL